MVVGKAETQKLREQIGRQFRQARLAAGLSQMVLGAVAIVLASTLFVSGAATPNPTI
jgi:hypothetical protein